MKKLLLDKEYLYLKFIYFIRYFGDALFYSFTVLFLASLGFKEGIIGNIQSIITITGLLINPLWSIFARNNKTIKKLLIVLSIVEGILMIFYSTLTTVEIIMLLTAFLAIVSSPFYNLLDGYSATFCDIKNKEYSSIRVFGSLAYALGTFVGGVLIDIIGFTNVFIIAGIIFIVCGILSSFLHTLYILDETGKEKKREYKIIVKNKRFIFYLLSYILVVTVSAIGDGYISLYFTSLKGLSVTNYSYISTCILLTEVVTILLLTKYAKKVRLDKLFIIAGILYFFRSFVLSFTFLPDYILIPFSLLRGVAWGIILYSHMKYLIKLVNLENVTTAAILVSTSGAVVSFILNNCVGYVIEYFGYNVFYLSISLIILTVTIINIIYYLINNKRSYVYNS